MDKVTEADRERALKLFRLWPVYCPKSEDENVIQHIAQALASERARVREEDCKAVCAWCKDGYRLLEDEGVGALMHRLPGYEASVRAHGTYAVCFATSIVRMESKA